MKGRGKTGRPKSFDRDVALQRAVGHFLTNGYKGAGMRDLLASMGIARQSLYDTFVSKRELFLEALKAYELNAMKEYNALFLEERSPLQKIETLIYGWTEKAKQEPFQGCLINHAVVDMVMPIQTSLKWPASTSKNWVIYWPSAWLTQEKPAKFNREPTFVPFLDS